MGGMYRIPLTRTRFRTARSDPDLISSLAPDLRPQITKSFSAGLFLTKLCGMTNQRRSAFDLTPVAGR